MKWRCAAVISFVPFAVALARGPYDGTYSGPIQPGGGCDAYRANPLTLTVADNVATAQVVALGGWRGNLDGSGKGTLMSVGVRNPRSLSITVSGDKFDIRGDISCGSLNVSGKRNS